jgi:hypothetical protein
MFKSISPQRGCCQVLSHHNLLLHLNQFILGNLTDDLLGILGEFAEGDGQLFGAEGPALVDLFREGRQNERIGPIEPHPVVVTSGLGGLFISRLTFPQLDDGPSGPGGVGGELVLDVGDNRFVHRENSIDQPG